MNDDVLREAFDQFTNEELDVMADVCLLFRRIAQIEFASRYRKVYFTSITLPVDETWPNTESIVRKDILYVNHSQWTSFLRKFDDAIISLEFSGPLSEYKLPLKAIAKCGSLVEVELCQANWTNELILEWQPLLSQLREFRLHYSNFMYGANASQMLSFCVELQTLSINRSHAYIPLGQMLIDTPVVMPKLKILDLSRSELENDAVEHLISSNPQLEEIRLPSTALRYGLISTHVPNIEKLEFSWNGEDIEDWSKLKNLKSLGIWKSGRVASLLKAIAAADIPLETLSVYEFEHCPEFNESISTFKSLKKLHLSFLDLNSTDVLEIVRNLPNLNIFSTYSER